MEACAHPLSLRNSPSGEAGMFSSLNKCNLTILSLLTPPLFLVPRDTEEEYKTNLGRGDLVV